MRKILKHFNGWIGFLIGTILFFVAPHVYHVFDPTAGQFDAGYIHPIVYAFTVITFASAMSWGMIYLLAPGGFRVLDQWLESPEMAMDDRIKSLLKLYALIMTLIVVIICSMV